MTPNANSPSECLDRQRRASRILLGGGSASVGAGGVGLRASSISWKLGWEGGWEWKGWAMLGVKGLDLGVGLGLGGIVVVGCGLVLDERGWGEAAEVCGGGGRDGCGGRVWIIW